MTGKRRVAGRWLTGLLVGAVAGFAILEGGVLGLIVIVLLAIWLRAGSDPQVALGGLLVGIGTGIVALTARAELACDPASCVSPDLTMWYAFFTGLVAVGLALTLLGARRRAPPDDPGQTR